MPNEALVIVKVADENDNAPRFTSDHILAGVPFDAPYNHFITTLQVTLLSFSVMQHLPKEAILFPLFK